MEVEFNWKELAPLISVCSENGRLFSMNVMNIGDYGEVRNDFFDRISWIMPKSEIRNVVEYFRIPEYQENYPTSFITNIILKLIIFVPRTTIPEDIITNWINIAHSYYMHDPENYPKYFNLLFFNSIFYSPDYNWGKMFEKENMYSLITNTDDQNLQITLIPYDKPLETTHIRPLLNILFRSLKFIQISKQSDNKKEKKLDDTIKALYRLNKIFMKIKIYKDNNKNVNYYELTNEENEELAKWSWPLIEFVYFII